MAPRALVGLDYAWRDRTARVERTPHGWIVHCAVEGGPSWMAERDACDVIRAMARAWVEGRLGGPYHQRRPNGTGALARIRQAELKGKRACDATDCH